MLTKELIEQIENAEARAFATCGPQGVNVVPVSVLSVNDGAIYLYNFFMSKSVENIQNEADVALCVWSGLVGIQIRAQAEYLEGGDFFESEKVKMKEQFPERTLFGLIKLTPESVFDVSAQAGKAGVKLA